MAGLAGRVGRAGRRTAGEGRLGEGDDIEITIADERLLGVSRAPGRAELIDRLDEFRGRLPADFKFDRNGANER